MTTTTKRRTVDNRVIAAMSSILVFYQKIFDELKLVLWRQHGQIFIIWSNEYYDYFVPISNDEKVLYR